MIRLVLFDIDGTLIHTSGAGEKAFAQVFATQFNVPAGTDKIKFAGRTDTSVVRECFLHNKIEPSPENFRRFFDAYVFWLDHFLHRLPGGAPPGVREMIKSLRALPQPPLLGLLTGNIRLGAEIKLRRHDLWNIFEMGGFADSLDARNDIARLALKRGRQWLGENLCGEEIIVIGDTPLDIACGRAIDAKVLAVATGSSRLLELQEHRPDWAVEDLRQLTAKEICA